MITALITDTTNQSTNKTYIFLMDRSVRDRRNIDENSCMQIKIMDGRIMVHVLFSSIQFDISEGEWIQWRIANVAVKLFPGWNYVSVCNFPSLSRVASLCSPSSLILALHSSYTEVFSLHLFPSTRLFSFKCFFFLLFSPNFFFHLETFRNFFFTTRPAASDWVGPPSF